MFKVKNIIASIIILVSSLPLYAASLHELKSTWLDQDSNEFKMSDLKGSSIIIGMVYTGCAHACPMTISKIQEIENAIKKKVKYKVILASFDVKNDKPDKLLKQIKTRKLDTSKWKMLSAANDEQARELALILGISYKDLGDGDFSHSNAISLLNGKGEIVSRIEGLNSDISEMVKIINAP